MGGLLLHIPTAKSGWTAGVITGPETKTLAEEGNTKFIL